MLYHTQITTSSDSWCFVWQVLTLPVIVSGETPQQATEKEATILGHLV